MLRLILDFLGRSKRIYGLAWAALTALWYFGPPWVGLSLVAAVLLGPAVAMAIAPTEIRYLPVSRRDLWRARWAVGAVPPVLIGMAAKFTSVALGGLTGHASRIDKSWIFTSSFLDFIYVGAILGMFVLLDAPLFRLVGRRPLVGAFMAFALMMAAVFMPVRADLWPWSPRLLVASSVALSIWGWVRYPKSVFSPRPPILTERGHRRTKRRSQPTRGGPVRLLWSPLLGVFAGVGIFMLFVAGFAAWTSGRIIPVGGVLSADPTDTQAMNLHILLMAMFSSFGSARDAVDLRTLRVLPVKTWQLAANWTSLAAVIWSSVWLSQTLGIVASTGRLPTSFRLELLFALIGTSSLVLCLRGLRRKSPLRGVVLVLLVPVVAFLYFGIVEFVGEAWTWPLGILGICGVAFAFHQNLKAIAGTNSLYKPIPLLPFERWVQGRR